MPYAYRDTLLILDRVRGRMQGHRRRAEQGVPQPTLKRSHPALMNSTHWVVLLNRLLFRLGLDDHCRAEKQLIYSIPRRSLTFLYRSNSFLKT